MSKFRLGISANLFGADGNPCFDPTILKVVSEHPNIEVSIMEQGKTALAKKDAEQFDGVYLMLERVEGNAIDCPDRALKLISRHGVGFDAIEVAEMTRLGIIVTNTPNAVRRPVASMAITLLLALSHRLLEKHNLTRAGRWSENADFMGTGLSGKNLGVLGAGSIGTEILRLIAPFDMNLLACDPNVEADKLRNLSAKKVDIDELFSNSDFLIVAASLNSTSYHLVNEEKLNLMKKSASLINIARGPIVKEQDLIKALKDGVVRGAALDVFEQEPVEQDNQLLRMDNVITTSHSLCWTDECFNNIARDGLGSIISFMKGEKPTYVVNKEVLLQL